MYSRHVLHAGSRGRYTVAGRQQYRCMSTAFPEAKCARM